MCERAVNGEPARRPGGAPRLAALVATAVGFLDGFHARLSSGGPRPPADPSARRRARPARRLESGARPRRVLLSLPALRRRRPGVRRRRRLRLARPAVRRLRRGMDVPVPLRLRKHARPVPTRRDAEGALGRLGRSRRSRAMARGRTLWALQHGLGLRAVNVEGLLDAAAMRESLFALSALASGVGFFFILRRAGAALREKALRAMLAGCGLSGALAVAERLGLPPGETSAFWKIDGPALGRRDRSQCARTPLGPRLRCGRGLASRRRPPASADRRRGGLGRGPRPLGIAERPASGGGRRPRPRSGAGPAGGAPAAARPRAGRGRRDPGPGGRSAPVRPRRPGPAARVFRGSRASRSRTAPRRARCSGPARCGSSAEYPIAGAGLGAFSWQLPNLLAEEGRALPLRDNPGNAYLQALAETGAIGFLLVGGVRVPGRPGSARGALGMEGEAARGRVRRGGARLPRRARLRFALVRAGRRRWPFSSSPPASRARGLDGGGTDVVAGRLRRGGRSPLRRRGGVRDARDAFAGRGVPLPSGHGIPRKGRGPLGLVLLDPAPFRDPAAARRDDAARPRALHAGRPPGRARRPRRTAKRRLREDAGARAGAPAAALGRSRGAAGLPVRALARLRAEAPGALAGPPRARHHRRFSGARR